MNIGVKRLLVLAFNNTILTNGSDGPNRVKRNSHRKYFLPRVNITNYNVLIDDRNFYDQSISDQTKSMIKLERLQQDLEMTTKLVAC